MKTHSLPVIPFPDTSIAGAEAQPKGFEPLLNTEEAARLIGGIHPKTLMKWAREGRVPGYQIARGWFFRSSELDSALLRFARIAPANVPA